MQRTGRTYEKPSWISQGLVVGLSIAVVLMAGWLAITIVFSHYATTSAVDSDKASAPVSAENVPSEPDEPRAAPVDSAHFEPSPRDQASPTPSQSALPLAPVAESPPTAARDPGYAPLSIATAVPDVDRRGIPAGLPSYPLSPAAGGKVGLSSETTEAIADLLRAPPPPPPSPPPHAAEGKVNVTSIPVPRPRPHLEDEDVQPAAPDVQQAAPEQSPFEWLISRRQ